jgi:hypothetical protein
MVNTLIKLKVMPCQMTLDRAVFSIQRTDTGFDDIERRIQL